MLKYRHMKQEKYKHIRRAERTEISFLLKRAYSQRDIAEMLERSVSSISEEISKNSVDGIYDPDKADRKAYARRWLSKHEGMKVAEDIQLRNYVEEKLQEDWSPEQIAGRIKEVDKDVKYASYQGIYKFVRSVYGRNIEKFLRYKGRRKGRESNAKKAQLENRVFIDKRPGIISKRGRYGDWEGDLIVSGKGGRGVLLVLHERKSRFPVIRRIMSQKTAVINRVIQEITGGFVCFASLTIDNDISFQKHEQLSSMIGAPVYFCHAYHSWEKGGVENTNKLIRQYVPKKTDISKLTDEYIKEVETKLQNRPRKCLSYKTPMEVMVENKQFKTLKDFGITILQKQNKPSVRLEG